MSVPPVKEKEAEIEDSITRCICDFQHDDGYMICCDKCRYIFILFWGERTDPSPPTFFFSSSSFIVHNLYYSDDI